MKENIMFRGLVWLGIFWPVNTLIGKPLMKSGAFGAFLIAVLYVVSFICYVLKPLRKVEADEPPAAKAVREARERTLKHAEAQRDFPRTSTEVFKLREQYAPDINQIFADTKYNWIWCGATTVSTLLISEHVETGTPANQYCYYGASFTPDEDGRVECIHVDIRGKDLVLYNKPYLQARKMERIRMDAPISELLYLVLGTVTWSWRDREEKEISITADGLRNAPAKIVFDDGGAVTDIVLIETGKSISAYVKQRVYADVESVKRETDAEEEATAIQPIEDEREAMSDPAAVRAALESSEKDEEEAEQEETESADDTPAKEQDTPSVPVYANVSVADEDMPAEERDALMAFIAAGGCDPETDPDIDDEVLKNAVRLVYEAEAADISSAAMHAMAMGDNDFALRWPEGLQSCKEALLFAQYTVDHAGFARAEVRKQNQTVRFFLQDDSIFME